MVLISIALSCVVIYLGQLLLFTGSYYLTLCSRSNKANPFTLGRYVKSSTYLNPFMYCSQQCFET